MPNVQRLLEKRVEAAMHAAFPEAEGAPLSGVAHRAKTDALVLPAQDPSFGDYQANGAMALAKRLGKKPREVAAAVVEKLDVSDLAEKPEIAGPGFINFRLKNDWVGRTLGAVNVDDRLGVLSAERPETVVVDYSAPNLAKEMHVGHLRSTIIGDALVRMLEFAGHKVVRQNHVGDWGTQFGMLVAAREEEQKLYYAPGQGAEGATLVRPPLEDIEALYREGADPSFLARAREVAVQLQKGSGPSAEYLLPFWKEVRDLSLAHCSAVYRRLGVLLTDGDVRGESAYKDDLPRVFDALKAKGLLKESQGAQCVFPEGFKGKDGEPLPLIVQKSDEGYLYATTDLAAIRYRVNELHADRILYVVDARQALHFQMLFAVARAAGFAPGRVKLVHVTFGTMMGTDGKPFRTRESGIDKLMDLLDEAENRAFTLVGEKSPELSETERREIARIIGIGAVKYADLAQNRTSDYVFSWEKMLSLAGNTAPYMQYAYARVRSIFRKGGHEAEDHRADAGPIPLAAPEELALGKMLLRFPETLDRTLDGYQPNVVAAYLYDLAQSFTAFYGACPVLKSEAPVRRARLRLCDLVARTIAKGLDLLGIEVADRM